MEIQHKQVLLGRKGGGKCRHQFNQSTWVCPFWLKVSFRIFFHSHVYWWVFVSWCSYASHHCTTQVPLVQNILHLPSGFFSLYAISFQITYPARYRAVLNQPHCPHSSQSGNVEMLSSFPVVGNYNSCRCRLTQGQGYGGTRSKQQYQSCLFMSLQTLGETHGSSVLLSWVGGALDQVNRPPISFGSHSCCSMTILSQST